LTIRLIGSTFDNLDWLRGHTPHNGVRRNILRNHRARRNDGTFAYCDPVGNDGAGPQPNIILDHNPLRRNALVHEWAPGIVKDMVDCDDLRKW
jgi:hypothetical protein